MHTPLPWTFEGGEWIMGPKGERIAQVYNWHAGYLDNGQLMANAPSLLKALELAKGAVEWMAEATDSDPEDHERLEIVNKAIKEATKWKLK